MSDEPNEYVELHFSLDIVDEWPPVGVEGVPATKMDLGYRIEEPPLFVKGLSCGDIISIQCDGDGNIRSWDHVSKSGHSTIWILRTGRPNNIEQVIAKLRALNCKVGQLPQLGSYSIDVPDQIPISEVDTCLEELDRTSAEVAFPSFRHNE